MFRIYFIPILFAQFVLSQSAAHAQEIDLPDEAREKQADQPVDDPKDTLEDLLLKLDSDDFSTREAAELQIWQKGEAVLDDLRKSIDAAPSPEVNFRVRSLLDLFEYGISPETPPEILRLIQKFRRGSDEDKHQALTDLLDRNETEMALKLFRRIDDPDNLEGVETLLSRILGEKFPALIEEGKYEEAEGLLKETAITTEQQVALAFFAHRRGSLKNVVIEYQQLVKLHPNRRDFARTLHWLLRADDRMEDAMAIAENLGDTKLMSQMKVIQGDFEPLFARGGQLNNQVQSFGWQLAKARWEGNERTEAAIVNAIVEYEERAPREAISCANTLGIFGFTDEALSILKKRNEVALLYLYLNRERIEDALELLGIPVDEATPKALAEALSVRFRSSVGNTANHSILDLCTGAFARYFENQEELLDPIFDTILDLGDEESITGAIRLAVFQKCHNAAVNHALKAIAAGIDRSVVERNLFFTSLPMADFLQEFLKQKFPDLSERDRLLRVCFYLHGEDNQQTAEQVAWMEQLSKSVRESKLAGEMPEKFSASGEGLSWEGVMTDVASAHGKWEDAIQWLEEDEQIDSETRLDKQSFLSLLAMKPENAVTYLRRLEKITPLRLEKRLSLAAALIRTGKVKEGEKILRAEGLSVSGNEGFVPYHYTVAVNFFPEFRERAELELKLFHRLSNPSQDYRVFIDGNQRVSLMEKMFEVFTRRDPALANACAWRMQLAFLNERGPADSIGRFEILSDKISANRVRFALSQNDVATARKELTRSLHLTPGNSSALEDAYPMLVKLGEVELANSFFIRVHEVATFRVERFPGYNQLKNNLAWLLSRCQRDLDKALALAEEAVQKEPRNGAFLDTLAEVHFARGEFAKAVEYSDKSLHSEVSMGGESQLQEQNARFRAALK